MRSAKQTGSIQKILLGLPLRKTLLASSGIAILLLLAVSILGVRQYLLYQHCEQVVATSQQLLFQFSTIKEHINETLLTRKELGFKNLRAEIEELVQIRTHQSDRPDWPGRQITHPAGGLRHPIRRPAYRPDHITSLSAWTHRPVSPGSFLLYPGPAARPSQNSCRQPGPGYLCRHDLALSHEQINFQPYSATGSPSPEYDKECRKSACRPQQHA